jgi:hypothetical protein
MLNYRDLLRAADRCARPGIHFGQKFNLLYLCPREHVFQPPRFDFGIEAPIV